MCVLDYAGKGRKISRRRKLNEEEVMVVDESSLLLPISIRRNIKKQQPKQNGSRKGIGGGIVLLFSLVEKERR